MFLHTLSNAEVLAELDKRVYGHRDAKKILINAVNRSQMIYYYKIVKGNTDFSLKPMNVLLWGKSGSGKSMLAEAIQAIVGFPAYRFDATQFTPTGGKGRYDAEAIIKVIREMIKCCLNMPNSRFFSKEGVQHQTFIVVEEVDKLAASFDSSGKWNEQIQAGLLTLMESKDDLEGVSWIMTGAFTGMKTDENAPNSIGFAKQDVKDKQEPDWDAVITKFGLLPELVGRITNVVRLDKLSLDDYERIFWEMLYPKALDDIALFGVDKLPLTQEKIDQLLQKSFKSDQGIRFMQKELAKITMDIEFYSEQRAPHEALYGKGV